MRLPLIVNWDARLNKRGPTVLVGKGDWEISNKNKEMVYLCEESPDLHTTLNPGSTLVIQGPQRIRIEFTDQAKESSVTIYAERK